ncbi:hypothetical protein [Salinigranum marinum]|uniref:hypothetical protein n=1 Tax=Salinigranum marinum TaxID=1515595 RepID=UPI002989E12E|nr:hypothetical protein [Salinigranum marinum]
MPFGRYTVPRTEETVYHGPAKRRDDATKVVGDIPVSSPEQTTSHCCPQDRKPASSAGTNFADQF